MTKLGELITTPEGRDAIHVAVAPVRCRFTLQPGQHVGLFNGSATEVDPKTHPVGIVDPFLTKPVQPGQRFWLVLYPQTVTNLRHEWSHPSFGQEVELAGKEASVKWITDYAATIGLSYDEVIAGAIAWLTSSKLLFPPSEHQWEEIPDEFWNHYEVVMMTKVDPDSKQSFIGCCP